MTDLDKLLYRLQACDEATEWAATQPDLHTAWESCERGDWMLWLAARLLPREPVVLAACDVAETTAPRWTDDTVLACVWALDAARRWAHGEAELDEVRAAAYAAYEARATSYNASYAAASASYAAAASAALAAASYAAASYAAASAATAAAAAAHDATASASLAESARIVREHISANDICAAAQAAAIKEDA